MQKDYGKMETKDGSFFLVFLMSLGVAESYQVELACCKVQGTIYVCADKTWQDLNLSIVHGREVPKRGV